MIRPVLGVTGVQNLADGTASRYTRELADLEKAIRAYRRAEASHGRGKRKSNNNNGVVAECSCPEPRKIRVSVSTYRHGPIVCGLCCEAFVCGVSDDEAE